MFLCGSVPETIQELLTVVVNSKFYEALLNVCCDGIRYDAVVNVCCCDRFKNIVIERAQELRDVEIREGGALT